MFRLGEGLTCMSMSIWQQEICLVISRKKKRRNNTLFAVCFYGDFVFLQLRQSGSEDEVVDCSVGHSGCTERLPRTRRMRWRERYFFYSSRLRTDIHNTFMHTLMLRKRVTLSSYFEHLITPSTLGSRYSTQKLPRTVPGWKEVYMDNSSIHAVKIRRKIKRKLQWTMKKYYSSVIHFMFQIVELRKFHREKFRLLVGFLFVVSAPMQMSIDSSNGLIFVKICSFFLLDARLSTF